MPFNVVVTREASSTLSLIPLVAQSPPVIDDDMEDAMELELEPEEDPEEDLEEDTRMESS